MEFVDKITHCEYKGCHQGDMLPFKCLHCTRSFCLMHKSATAHECAVGTLYQDMTSLDCPICGKAVKFSKAEDADAVWQRHYSLVCSQTPGANMLAAPARCPAKGCVNTLGPSNSFQCPHCRVNVCLTHRRVEDHACRFAPAKPSFGRPPPSSSSSSKPPAQAQAQAQHHKKARPPDAAPTRSGAQSSSAAAAAAAAAARRASSSKSGAAAAAAAASETAPSCPFCGLIDLSGGSLDEHVRRAHPEGQERQGHAPTRAAPAPAADPRGRHQGQGQGQGSEVCPQCSARFQDVLQLIQHVEAAHSSSSSSSAAATGSDCSRA